jgi:hypothetical protein
VMLSKAIIRTSLIRDRKWHPNDQIAICMKMGKLQDGDGEEAVACDTLCSGHHTLQWAPHGARQQHSYLGGADGPRTPTRARPPARRASRTYDSVLG